MAKHVSKQQQVLDLINEIQAQINRQNVDCAIPLLRWTKEKLDLTYTELNRRSSPRTVQRGKVYYALLGRNIGSEQNGYRPVLVVQEKGKNTTSPTVIVVPLTDALDKNGNPKKVYSTHIPVTHPQLSKPSIIKTEYVRSISKNRLRNEICELPDIIMKDVDKKLKESMSL